MATPLELLIQNYNKVAYISYFQSDRILSVYEGSFTLSGTSGGTVSAAVVIDANTDYFYAFGLFSVDGLNWYQMQPFVNELQTQQTNYLWAYLNINQNGFVNVGAFVWHPSSPATNHSGTIYYRVFLFDNEATGSVTVDSSVLPRNTTFFDSRKNYRKIYIEDNQSFTLTSGGDSITVNHNLGYIPFIQWFFAPSGINAGVLDGSIKARITETDVQFVLGANRYGGSDIEGRLYYRIFLEEN